MLAPDEVYFGTSTRPAGALPRMGRLDKLGVSFFDFESISRGC